MARIGARDAWNLCTRRANVTFADRHRGGEQDAVKAQSRKKEPPRVVLEEEGEREGRSALRGKERDADGLRRTRAVEQLQGKATPHGRAQSRRGPHFLLRAVLDKSKAAAGRGICGWNGRNGIEWNRGSRKEERVAGGRL
ncbi:hypothetical protein ERJ75_001554700 [Trypanosoma vivax]|nr:hypothetical protein ERJ75_001554700 [Trypanosoma vivax]